MPPHRWRLGGELLDRTYQRVHVEQGLGPVLDKVETAGYTLGSDGLTDKKGVNVINFCIGSRGIAALVDLQMLTEAETKDSDFMLHSMREGFQSVVERLVEAGVNDKDTAENLCIQVITDGASNCASARQLFAAEYPHMFEGWCALHCIGLFFKDVFNIAHFTSLYDDIHDVVKYFKSHNKLRLTFDNIRGANTGSRPSAPALNLPAEMRMAGKYMLLEKSGRSRDVFKKLLVHDDVLKFKETLSGEKLDTFNRVESLVNDNARWDEVADTVKLLQPAYIVMKVADSCTDAMSWIYGLSLRVLNHFKTVLDEARRKRSSGRLKEVRDHWEKRWKALHNPLHSFAYAVNPYFRKDKPMEDHVDVMPDVRKVLEKFLRKANGEVDFEVVGQALNELANFEAGNLDTPEEVIQSMTPDNIFFALRTEMPNVASIATKVLAQPVSVGMCERVWSNYGWIQSNLRGKLKTIKCKMLVCTYASLRLRDSDIKRKAPEGITSFMDEKFEMPKDWIVDESMDESNIFSVDVAQAEAEQRDDLA